MTTTLEKPILMSGPMVQAALAGRKSVTRRVVKLRGFDINEYPRKGCGLDAVGINADGMLDLQIQTAVDDCRIELFPCPYGAVGDRLWVREAWSPDHKDFYPNFPVVYRAEGGIEIENGKVFSPEAKRSFPFKWRPSIHMPRAASRLTLEIVKVSVERLQEITEEDCEREGFEGRYSPAYVSAGEIVGPDCEPASRDFIELWDKLNAERGYPYKSNPYVWRVEFKRLTA